MRSFRFHLGTLVIIVLLLGVGFAALREANETWDSSIFDITLGVLFISILLAVHRIESRRAFWVGFALFGSAYLGFSLVSSIEPRLITTKALAYLDSKVPGRSRELRIINIGGGRLNNQLSNVALTLSAVPDATARQAPVRRWDVLTGKFVSGWSGTTENFVRIGHSLFALLAGWVGGTLSRRLFRTSRHSDGSTQVSAELTNS